jgi:hypothetical protein
MGFGSEKNDDETRLRYCFGMGEDFTEKSKRKLADRAGHICSICNQRTTCSDQDGKPFRIADAAHIVGASTEGPRTAALFTTEFGKRLEVYVGDADRATD